MGDDCDRLLSELDHYLHGELPAERASALHQHLDACPPCLESADFQAQLKAMISRRCGEQVPDGLRDRVVGFLRDNASS
ncbi:MAG TPA: mycothiol system anti-sigma-R factor [Acidimicrobiales bacterium]|nr:mycothiol system anti-sigma-R factor [Acidimicrobiales bacterium]